LTGGPKDTEKAERPLEDLGRGGQSGGIPLKKPVGKLGVKQRSTSAHTSIRPALAPKDLSWRESLGDDKQFGRERGDGHKGKNSGLQRNTRKGKPSRSNE